MILGSGIKEKGGCVLVYRSHELSKGVVGLGAAMSWSEV